MKRDIFWKIRDEDIEILDKCILDIKSVEIDNLNENKNIDNDVSYFNKVRIDDKYLDTIKNEEGAKFFSENNNSEKENILNISEIEIESASDISVSLLPFSQDLGDVDFNSVELIEYVKKTWIDCENGLRKLFITI